MTIRYGLTSIGLTAAMLTATPTAAFAAWETTTREADVTARASVVPAPRDPVATAVGSAVTMAWKRARFAAVRGYRVTRTDARTGETVGARNGCSGLLTRPSCVELGVPGGQWRYAVETVVGATWRSEPAVGRAVRVFRVDRDSAPQPKVEPKPSERPAAPEEAGPEPTPSRTPRPDPDLTPTPTTTRRAPEPTVEPPPTPSEEPSSSTGMPADDAQVSG